ncbi:MAG: C45 family peptidase [Myxococcota bacterium]|nr:hypothetical protein [Myxococcales bacterium]MEC7750330.1 C45 family peptidase [Myxococcota bacterium]
MEIHRFRGEPREVGRAHGRRFQQGIRELASLRARLALARMGLESRTELDLLANQHVDVLARTDRDLYLEFIGLCEGSGVSPADMVILNNYTDLRDLTQGDLFPDGDAGCSAIFLPGDPPVIGQTWDMHGSAQHYVEVMEFAVDSAPRCLVFSLTGCFGMAGVNEDGVAVTINNLNTLGAVPGFLWPALVRLMLRASTAADAVAVLKRVGVGSGHHYQVADRHNFYGVEALPQQQEVIDRWTAFGDEPVRLTTPQGAFHTNHCLAPKNAQHERIPSVSTTHRRWRALEGIFRAEAEARPGALWQLLGDRQISMPADPNDPHKSATCGGLVVDWSGELPSLWVCRGPMTHATETRVRFSEPATV